MGMPWTERQEHDLMRLWPIPGVSREAIACVVGRTVIAVTSKASELRVHRPAHNSPFWLDDPARTTEALESAHAGETLRKAAERIGCTRNALIGRLNRLSTYRGHPSRGARSTMDERLAAYPVPQGCRFIHGDVRAGGWHYCDEKVAVVGASFCPEHMKLCHQKAGQMHPELRDALKWRWRR
jgi:hypothetical protein